MICAAMMSDTVCAACVHLREGGDHGFLRGGLRDEPQQHLRDDAERAFRADEQIAQRIAGHVLHALVAGPADFAVGQDDFEAHDVIARDAVFQAAQAAGILRHVAADGGDLHRAGIGRIKQARRAGAASAMASVVTPASTSSVRFARSSSRMRSIFTRQSTMQSGHGQAAAAQAGARTARDDGRFGRVGELQDCRDLLGGCGEHDAAGHLLHRRRAVERVGDEVFLGGEDVFRTDDLPECGEGVLRECHSRCSRRMLDEPWRVKETEVKRHRKTIFDKKTSRLLFLLTDLRAGRNGNL